MYIALIIWLVFLFAYVSFNIYGVVRVAQMRIKGDITSTAILIYLLVMAAIIVITLTLVSRLNWGITPKLF